MNFLCAGSVYTFFPLRADKVLAESLPALTQYVSDRFFFTHGALISRKEILTTEVSFTLR